jgi:hypothetical protein
MQDGPAGGNQYFSCRRLWLGRFVTVPIYHFFNQGWKSGQGGLLAFGRRLAEFLLWESL